MVIAIANPNTPQLIPKIKVSLTYIFAIVCIIERIITRKNQVTAHPEANRRYCSDLCGNLIRVINNLEIFETGGFKQFILEIYDRFRNFSFPKERAQIFWQF